MAFLGGKLNGVPTRVSVTETVPVNSGQSRWHGSSSEHIVQIDIDETSKVLEFAAKLVDEFPQVIVLVVYRPTTADV